MQCVIDVSGVSMFNLHQYISIMQTLKPTITVSFNTFNTKYN